MQLEKTAQHVAQHAEERLEYPPRMSASPILTFDPAAFTGTEREVLWLISTKAKALTLSELYQALFFFRLTIACGVKNNQKKDLMDKMIGEVLEQISPTASKRAALKSGEIKAMDYIQNNGGVFLAIRAFNQEFRKIPQIRMPTQKTFKRMLDDFVMLGYIEKREGKKPFYWMSSEKNEQFKKSKKKFY